MVLRILKMIATISDSSRVHHIRFRPLSILWHCYIVRRYWAPAERRHSKFWWWWWWW